ncbi:MAG: RagB/SusD family nutrient uptake outer membrane protein [Bacteroidales bacterium]
MKTMKHIKILRYSILVLLLAVLPACEEYLDKAPEAEISEKEVFGTFRSFQGFVEELYHCIPDYTKGTWVDDWNIADELLATTGANWRLTVAFDNGDYWAWQHGNGWSQSYIGNPADGANTDNNAHTKNLWDLSWYGIRKCNIGLQNFDKLVAATEEEKRAIKGQLLFFRAFFHFQIMSFWGGIPYIDKDLASEKMNLPRLSYREVALRAAQDFEEAAQLLPVDWDKSPVGQRTLGNNYQRITKSVALAYLGKNYLYAASPLMNLVSTGNASYDVELCKKAAEAFYQCLYLSYTGQAPYKLIEWERYEENFYTLNDKLPGIPEHLLAAPNYGGAPDYYSNFSLFFPPVLGGDGNMISPAHNYVKNFGMANGLPIDDPESGYDETDPWSNRDPRFYKFIVYDGVQVVKGGTSANDNVRYANLYNGGNYRDDGTGSRSGYLLRKFMNLTNNNIDAEGRNIIVLPAYLRLADVYYMYAEAVLHGYGTPQSYYPGNPDYVLTAADAVNTVRARAGVPNVHDKYLTSKEAFMQELIRERAVELCYEANIRFMDLRRWLLAEDMKYRVKTAIDFDRSGTPPNTKPINMKERTVMVRVVEKKHYWLPFPTKDVNLYPEFPQNPGW